MSLKIFLRATLDEQHTICRPPRVGAGVLNVFSLFGLVL
jgi:hypothetical protein